MSFSSKHTTTKVCTKGKNTSGSCVSGSCGTRAPPAPSGKCFSSANGAGMSARSYCGGMSYGGGLTGGSCVVGGFGGNAFGDGYVCAPGGGFGGGGVCYRPVGVRFGFCNEAPLLSCDEKLTMQNLNDRLASYLDKVRCLEDENAHLECKIRAWYDQQAPLHDPKDYSSYHQQIEDLRNQIICATVDNSKLVLDVDNNRMTAEDFRMKFETEFSICQNVEADVSGLRQALDHLTLCRSDLEAQLESLQGELCYLKKNHEEEVKSLKNQTTGDVSVEVNSCPGPDLKKILEEMRSQYETMIENNRKDVEQWYERKVEEVSQAVSNSSKEAEECSNKVVDLKRQLQTLEIDLQTQLSLRDTLQDSLTETECRYNNHLAEIQNQISCVQHQLVELREEMECQNQEYKNLLDVKCRLEHEIQTYRCLLEGVQHDIANSQSCGSSGGAISRKTGGNVGKTPHTCKTVSSRSCTYSSGGKGYSG